MLIFLKDVIKQKIEIKLPKVSKVIFFLLTIKPLCHLLCSLSPPPKKKNQFWEWYVSVSCHIIIYLLFLVTYLIFPIQHHWSCYAGVNLFSLSLSSDFKSTMKGLFEEAKLNRIQIFSILIYFCFYVHTSALEIYDLHKITFDLTNEDKILFPLV